MKHIYFITGASKGLGEAFTKTLLSENHTIHCFSRSTNPDLQELADQSKASLTQHPCDVSNYEVVTKTVNTLLEGINWDDVSSFTLINNAGILNPISVVGKNNENALIKNLDVNLRAPIYLSELIISRIQNLDIKKYVLNISSGAARNPYHGWAAYCTSKAGLDMFTKCIGVEQRDEKYPVKMIAFAPGVVDTNMQDQIRSTSKEQFKNLDKFIDLKNNNLLLDPDYVAQQLLKYLTSDATETGGRYDIREFS